MFAPGGTASGKTTVCDLIMQRLHDQCVVMLSQGLVLSGPNGGGTRKSHRVCEAQGDLVRVRSQYRIRVCLADHVPL